MKKIIGLFALLSAPAMSDSIGYWHFDEGLATINGTRLRQG